MVETYLNVVGVGPVLAVDSSHLNKQIDNPGGHILMYQVADLSFSPSEPGADKPGYTPGNVRTTRTGPVKAAILHHTNDVI